MKKDVTEKRLEEWDDVFADIFNHLILNGNEILKEDELHSRTTMAYTRQLDGSVRGGMRDIWKACGLKGQFRLICGIENQSEIDYSMPERIMGYEYADYEAQIKKLMDENKKKGHIAGSKRIFPKQRLNPVITGVLYYGRKNWKNPVRLHDMIQFPDGLEEILKPYVADYPINLVQVARLTKEERESLTSDFRIVAEYLASWNDVKTWEMFVRNAKEIRHTEELLDTLWSISGDERFEMLCKKIRAKEFRKEKWNMCEILDYVEGKGIKKGMRRGVRKGIHRGIQTGIRAMIQENLEMGLCKEEIEEKIQRYFKTSRKNIEKCYEQVLTEKDSVSL